MDTNMAEFLLKDGRDICNSLAELIISGCRF